MSDIVVRVSNTADDTSAHGLCTIRHDPIVPPDNATLNCSAPIRGRYVRIQRKNPNIVDSIDLCEVTFELREGSSITAVIVTALFVLIVCFYCCVLVVAKCIATIIFRP